jgi:hypothetical protein
MQEMPEEDTFFWLGIIRKEKPLPRTTPLSETKPSLSTPISGSLPAPLLTCSLWLLCHLLFHGGPLMGLDFCLYTSLFEKGWEDSRILLDGMPQRPRDIRNVNCKEIHSKSQNPNVSEMTKDSQSDFRGMLVFSGKAWYGGYAASSFCFL